MDQLPDARFSGEPRELVRLLLHGRSGRSLGRSPHRELTAFTTPSTAATAAATERSSLMSAWINSMPSPTSGKRASVRSGCRDATRIENSCGVSVMTARDAAAHRTRLAQRLVILFFWPMRASTARFDSLITCSISTPSHSISSLIRLPAARLYHDREGQGGE